MLELDPPQPPAVERTLEALLDAHERDPDPWWAEGLAEALDAQGDVTARPRSSRGADRA